MRCSRFVTSPPVLHPPALRSLGRHLAAATWFKTGAGGCDGQRRVFRAYLRGKDAWDCGTMAPVLYICLYGLDRVLDVKRSGYRPTPSRLFD